MTKESEVVRDRFEALVKKYGYRSIRNVCLSAGITASNLYSNITGVYDISIKRMFRIANVLGCDVTEVIDAFHHDLYEENKEIVAEGKKLPVEVVENV